MAVGGAKGRAASGASELQRPTARSLIKTALIVAALAFETPAIWARIAMLGVTPGLPVYIGLYVFLALCLGGAAMIRQPVLRWGWAILFAAATIFLGSFQTAAADAMSYETFISMLQSAGFIDDAVAQYRRPIAWASANALLLLVGIGLKPASRRLPGILAGSAPFLGLALLSTLLFFRGGEGGRGLPSAWVGSAYSVLYGFESITRSVGPRQPVRIARTRPPTYRDIVLIIDESIAARYLDINDPQGVRSGLASPPSGLSVANFGIAASITDCSFGSNMTLRHGGTRAAYNRINATGPSIFAYAKAAGFRTVYVDAQRTGGAFQNGMDAAERGSIDHFIQFDDTPAANRDMAAAGAVIDALANDRREFILVNKMGAHFPIADKFPDTAAPYQPTLPRGHSADVAEMQLPENLYSGAENWRLYRNSYRNTVAWTVGGFFDRLFAHARLRDALIIYTSDHGQKLHERGDSGTTTHCSVVPVAEEGAVPLVAIDASGRWQAAAKRHFDASSHYRIFPTLLAAMGYDPVAVRRSYGETLDSTAPDPATFNGLFNARLGRQPMWVGVRRPALPAPPASDIAAR